MKKALAWLIILMTGLLAVAIYNAPLTAPGAKWPATDVPASPAVAAPKTNPRAYKEDQIARIKLDVREWRLGGFSTVMIVTMKIENNNDFAVKDILVECTTYARSGTELSRPSKRLYERFEPNKPRTVRDFNVGFVNSQSASGGCEVTDFVLG